MRSHLGAALAAAMLPMAQLDTLPPAVSPAWRPWVQRGRSSGRPSPAGTKLWRKAQEGKLGLRR